MANWWEESALPPYPGMPAPATGVDLQTLYEQVYGPEAARRIQASVAPRVSSSPEASAYEPLPTLPEPPAPANDPGNLLVDVPSSIATKLATGTFNVLPGFYSLADALTGGRIDTGRRYLQSALQGGLANLAGDENWRTRPEDIEPFATSIGNATQAIHDTLATEGVKAHEAKLAGMPLGMDYLKTVVSDLVLLTGQVAQSIPSVIGIAGPARAAGKYALTHELAAAEKIADPAAKAAAIEAAKVAAEKVAERTAIGMNFPMSGGSSALQVQQDILTMPANQLAQQFPEYEGLRQQVGDQSAREQLANRAALKTGLISGGLGLGASVLTQGGIESQLGRALVGAPSRATAEKAAATTLPRAILKGAGQEALEEVPQSAGEQFGQNVGENLPWSQGVAASGALGGILAAITGGLFGGVQRGVTQQAANQQATERGQQILTVSKPYLANLPAVADTDLANMLMAFQQIEQTGTPHADVRQGFDAARTAIGTELMRREQAQQMPAQPAPTGPVDFTTERQRLSELAQQADTANRQRTILDREAEFRTRQQQDIEQRRQQKTADLLNRAGLGAEHPALNQSPQSDLAARLQRWNQPTAPSSTPSPSLPVPGETAPTPIPPSESPVSLAGLQSLSPQSQNPAASVSPESGAAELSRLLGAPSTPVTVPAPTETQVPTDLLTRAAGLGIVPTAPFSGTGPLALPQPGGSSHAESLRRNAQPVPEAGTLEGQGSEQGGSNLRQQGQVSQGAQPTGQVAEGEVSQPPEKPPVELPTRPAGAGISGTEGQGKQEKQPVIPVGTTVDYESFGQKVRGVVVGTDGKTAKVRVGNSRNSVPVSELTVSKKQDIQLVPFGGIDGLNYISELSAAGTPEEQISSALLFELTGDNPKISTEAMMEIPKLSGKQLWDFVQNIKSSIPDTTSWGNIRRAADSIIRDRLTPSPTPPETAHAQKRQAEAAPLLNQGQEKPLRIAQRWNQSDVEGRAALLQSSGISEELSRYKAAEWDTWDKVPEGPIKKRLREAGKVEEVAPSAPVEKAPEEKAPALDLNALFDEVLNEELAKTPIQNPTISFDADFDGKPRRVKDARLVNLGIREITGDEQFAVHPSFDEEGGYDVSHVATGKRVVTRSSMTEERAIEDAVASLRMAGRHRFEQAIGAAPSQPKKAPAKLRTKNKATPSKTLEPRTAGEAATSAAKNVVMGLDDALNGLIELFGSKGRLSSGLTFDEETYRRAKPLFQSAVAHFKEATRNVKEAMRLVIQELLKRTNNDRAMVDAMKPYVVRFIEDIQNGPTNTEREQPGMGEVAPRGGETGTGAGGRAGTKPRQTGATAGNLEAESPEDVATPTGPDAGITAGGGASGSVLQGRKEVDESGLSSVRRGGTSDGGLVDDGTRSAGTARDDGGVHADAPVITYPNYFIQDPKLLLSGGPKTRFAKNKKAIETYRELSETGLQPTPEQLDELAAYTGWGSFGQELFQGSWNYPRPKLGWEAESKWMRDYLGQDEWESAQSSILNAHYTDPPTVTAMWDIVRKLGFSGGRVLEPSMGVGNFFGLMPRDLMASSQLTGIELDSLTAGIAKLLYPDAFVHQMGYQDSKTADDFYDLVIGNWPFAKQGPSDRRYRALSPSLHDYFFLKALDQTRPGGLVVGVTSMFTMDKKGSGIRTELAKKAELVAAFRLPTGAFEEYAGTRVVTDILVLKKRETPLANSSSESWVRLGETISPSGPLIEVNQYYLDHPNHILGKLDYGHGTTTGHPGVIVERPADYAARLTALADQVPEKIYTPRTTKENVRYLSEETKDRQQSVTLGKNGKLYQVQGERLAILEDVLSYAVKDQVITTERESQIRDLVGLRRQVNALFAAERNSSVNDASVEAMRTALNQAYQAFVTAHGPINESFGLKYLRKLDDPYFPDLAALEVQREGQWQPATVLQRATTRGRQKLGVLTVADALVVARNERIDFDIERVAELAKTTRDQAATTLLDAGAVFQTPDGRYEAADQYLSGNVRRKLREAKAAQEEGVQGMERNIKALEKVIPKDVPYYNIEARMGAPWIPIDIYANFLDDLLGQRPEGDGIIVYLNNVWKVRKHAVFARAEADRWKTGEASFRKIFQAALNVQQLTIRVTDEDGNKVVDEQATKEANQKVNALREEFSGWVWKDAERQVALERTYNEIMNAVANPEFDGSFLRFEGMVLQRGNQPFQLRQHQINAIYRGLVNQRGLYAHEVGTGKTYTIAGVAVESRRYGLARKPLILAHNANSQAVADGVVQMYPNAKVLYINNLDRESIETKLRQIKTDDWDAIVMPHSLIERLTLTGETLQELAKEQIQALEEEAYTAAEEDMGAQGEKLVSDALAGDEKALKKLRSPSAKDLVRARNKIIAKINDQALRASREGAISFEELGVDQIIVDEAHLFKKPPLETRMKLRGLSTASSGRSLALNFLVNYIKKSNGGKGVHLFTGTPITNTLTETFHMMRYVMDNDMRRDGIMNWDAWFNTFASETDDIEITASGEYEPVTRLAAFINVADLRRMMGTYTDIVFADDMPEFKPRTTASGKTMMDTLTDAERKELLDGRTEESVGRPYKKVLVDSADMTPQQSEIMTLLTQRTQDFRAASRKVRREIMLSGGPESPILVETAAANSGLDQRLFKDEGRQIYQTGSPNSKSERVVRNVIKHYHEHPLTTQAIFMERGFDAKGFNLAKAIVDDLVAQGIPRNQIAIVDGKTDSEKRKAIADSVNRAEIRVVIGNTQTLGTGVNMQDNLRAMHHLDAPWTPAELEQRNGRGHRQGNKWNTVFEYRYLTERIDGRRWQVLAVKDRFIKAFLKADENLRVIEGDSVDDSQQSDIISTLSEAAGDPRILIINKLKADLEKLQSRERLHGRAVVDAKHKLKSLIENIELPKKRRIAYEQYKETAEDFQKSGEKNLYIIDGQSFTERQDAQEAMDMFIRRKIEPTKGPKSFGKIRGLTLWYTWAGFQTTPVDFYIGETIDGEHAPLVKMGKPTVFAAENAIWSLPRRINEAEDEISASKQSIANLERIATEPFGRSEELKRKKEQLARVEEDLQANPVPPPSWLRNGAPVDSVAYHDGTAYVVTGHRWTPNNYLVDMQVDGGVKQLSIPYDEVTDQQGIPLYEPRPFVAPIVAQRSNDQPQFAAASHTPSTLLDALKALGGSRLVQDLLDAGKLKVVPFQRNLPAHITVPQGQRVGGAVDPRTGAVYLIAENINPAETEGFLIHEVGVHQQRLGLDNKSKKLRLAHALFKIIPAKQVIGENKFNDVLNQLNQLRNKEVPSVLQAFEEAKTAMEALGQNLNNKELIAEEALAYLTAKNPKIPLVRRLLAAIRAFLYKTGIKIDLTPDDLQSLALSALFRANSYASVSKESIESIFADTDIGGNARKTVSVAQQVQSSINAPIRSSSISGLNFVPSQKFMNSREVNIKLFGDLMTRDLLINKGFDALPIKRQHNVLAHMIDGIHDPQIFDAIVQAVPVDMMNMLIGKEFATNSRFDNQAMLLKHFPVNPTLPISTLVKRFVEIVAKSPFGTGAIHTTKSSSHLNLAGEEMKFDATMGTMEGKHGISPEQRTMLGDGAASTASSPPIIKQLHRFAISSDLGISTPTLTADELLAQVQAGTRTELTPDEWGQVQQAFLNRAVDPVPLTGVNAPTFKDWFGASKIKNKAGQPLVMYHGTPAHFTAFNATKSGQNTTHPTAALGFFFTNNRQHAEAKYGDNVMETYLAIEKPYSMTDADLRKIESLDDARQFRQKLEDQGYDGIVMPAETGTRYVAAFYPDQIKLTRNATYTRGERDMRFSYAGEKAATANQSLLQQAKMRVDAGEDAETVRKETGWHQGADKKWRFEIDDSQATFNLEILGDNKFHMLPDLLQHPTLFLSYPELNNIKVINKNRNYSSTDGKSYIKLGKENKNESLIHEVQHIIQKIEGFDSGGNPENYEKRVLDDDLMRAGFTLDLAMANLGRDGRNLRRYLIDNEARFPVGVLVSGAKSYDAITSAEFVIDYAIKNNLKELHDAAIDYIEAAENAGVTAEKSYEEKKAAHQIYKELPGETEARDTTNRLKLTPAQRRATPPYRETMFKDGIQDEDIIVRMDNSRVAASQQRFAIARPLPGAIPPTETAAQAVQRTLQDKVVRFQVVQDWLKKSGLNLTPAADVYGAEALLPKKTAARIETAREKILKPLIQRAANNRWQLGGGQLIDALAAKQPLPRTFIPSITEFLHAQHAPERNRQIAQINPKFADPDTPGSGITDAQAAAILARYRALPNYAVFARLAHEFQAITNQNRQILLNAGIIAHETADAWQGAYQHYVPLKGGPEDQPAKAGTGPGLSVGGKQHRALGHTLRDENIIENIWRDHERAIYLSEKQTVARALRELLQQANNSAIGTVGQPEKRAVLHTGWVHQVWIDGAPLGVYPSYNDAKAAIAADSLTTGRAVSRYGVRHQFADESVIYVSRPPLTDNEVALYENGQLIRLQLNDELMARAARNLGVDAAEGLLKAGQVFNRYLSTAYTGYNPEFLLTNIARDFTTGFINLTGHYGIGIAAKALRAYPTAVKALWAYLRGQPNALVERYRQAGGSTGASYLSDLERIGTDLKRVFQDAQGARATWQGGEKLGAARVAIWDKAKFLTGWIEKMNAVGENALRLATFKTLLDQGKSETEAARAAGDVTVNFNRKGEMTATLGGLYLFFNPAVQGTKAIWDAMSRGEHRGQAIALAGSLALLALTLAELARGGSDDDERKWKRIPGYVKDRNLIIPLAGKDQISIPVPYGYGAFWSLGNLISDLAHGERLDQAGIRMASALFENFSPIGNPFAGDEMSAKNIVSLLPTALKPPVAIAMNRNELGRPIMPEEQAWNSAHPDSARKWRSTQGTVYDAITENLNRWTGGSAYQAGAVDISPESLRYLWRTLTGGIGQFTADTANLLAVVGQGAGLQTEPREWPIARRFIRTESVQDARTQFQEQSAQVRQAVDAFNAAKRARDVSAMREISTDNRELLALGKVLTRVRDSVKISRSLQDQINRSNLSLSEKRNRLQELDRQETAIYDRFWTIFERATHAEQRRKAI